MSQELLTVLKQEEIAPNIFELILKGKMTKEIKNPGQFLHLLVPRADLLLRRPISICDYDNEAETMTLLYRIEGDGTKSLTDLKENDKISTLGPLGNGFNISEIKKNDVVYLIGGGIGIPPLYGLAKECVKKGAIVHSFLGFQKQANSYYVEKFQEISTLHLTSDDGSLGEKGLVLDPLKNFPRPDALYACGPNGMLKTLDTLYFDHPRAFLSLESRMACGIGACYGCIVQDKKNPTKNKKVCDEGPVFQTNEVVL